MTTRSWHIPLRNPFIERVRLQHVLVAVTVAQRGSTVSSTFVGDGDEGRYVHQHPDGPVLHVAWDPAGLVLLAFDPCRSDGEWSLPPAERDPEALFSGCPEALGHLVSELVMQTDRLATAALWVATPRDGAEEVDFRGDDDRMDRLLRAAHRSEEEAARLLGEEDDVADDVAVMAAGLSARAARGVTTVTPAEEVMLLTPPPRSDPVPSPVDVRQARGLLAEVGVAWPDAETNAKRVGDEVRRLRALGDTDQGLALLTAVHRGDLAAAAALITGGANLERRSPPGFLPYLHGGESPLMVAVLFRHHAIVKLLLEHRADPNSQVGGYTPLVRAVEARNVELCRVLLTGGGSLTVDWNDRTKSVLEHTRNHPDAEVMRLLLDAGAPLPHRGVCEDLADIARRSGADDLVARLLPEP